MSSESPEPGILRMQEGEQATVALTGAWTAEHARTIEGMVDRLPEELQDIRRARVDIADIARLDTLGALVISRLKRDAGSEGLRIEIVNARPEHEILLSEVSRAPAEVATLEPRAKPFGILADIGETVVDFGRDLVKGTAFLGEVVFAIGKAAVNPQKFRGPSLVNQIELIALRGAPIIILISFLVGAIVAQQGIFQLRRFAASQFVVNMAGILSLRELGVLLASIMVAGRSGSAFTAELGSMKMREEIDALRVMGLDPIAVLVAPRILALLISLPIVAFIASMSSIFGAILVSWLYDGLSPEVFVSRLRNAMDAGDFAVGLIKAPFMALMIGLIACQEGLAVKGSAESLGRQVTSSVVKSIFMVIVVDGLFAMFFAAIKL